MKVSKTKRLMHRLAIEILTIDMIRLEHSEKTDLLAEFMHDLERLNKFFVFEVY